MMDAQRTVEEVARASYGRLVAYLAFRTRDVAGAEDALGDALLSALSSWPVDGVPRDPEAWLLTAARHRFIDAVRHERMRADHADTLRLLASEKRQGEAAGGFPDERLRLFFVCAHPAIDSAVHTPLMLQTVLGLNAARIAQAFLVSPATMGQRLTRAKMRIREAGIPFEVPEDSELPQRLDAVLEAIYAAFGIGWTEASGTDQRGRDLAEEAIWLSRVLRQRMPDEPEVRGLLALMLFCEARRAARRTSDGRYIPLSEQDPGTWSSSAISEAEAELGAAASRGEPGRFQFEAAIQSVHADRARTGRTDWMAIAAFYEQIIRLAPTLGARVGQAAAIAEAQGPEAGLALLDRFTGNELAAYQPYWAVRSHLLRRVGRASEAVEALERAVGLTEDDAVRRFLLDRRA